MVTCGLGVNPGLPVTCNTQESKLLHNNAILCILGILLICCILFFFCRKQIFVPVRVQGLENVRLIAVGAFHNLALEEDGRLMAWGNNEYGQLGTGDTQPTPHPVPIQGLDGLTLVCFLSLPLFFYKCNKLFNSLYFFKHILRLILLRVDGTQPL